MDDQVTYLFLLVVIAHTIIVTALQISIKKSGPREVKIGEATNATTKTTNDEEKCNQIWGS